MAKFLLEVDLTDLTRCDECFACDLEWARCQKTDHLGFNRPKNCPLIEGDLKEIMQREYQRGYAEAVHSFR